MEDLGGGKARIDLDAGSLCLFGQPSAQIAETDDEVAVVLHLRRRGQPNRAGLVQEQEAVLGCRRVQRRATLLPVGEQFRERPRLEHGARKDVRADLGTLFQDTDRDVPAALLGKLAQTNRGRQAGRPGADDDDVIFHRIPFHHMLRQLAIHRPRCWRGRLSCIT